MIRYSLCGEWQFKRSDEDKWQPATVPGCNYTDLLNNGVIPDPFYGLNESKVYDVALHDWVYTREFEVTAEQLAHEKVELVAEMLDTLCDVELNGQVLGHCDNSNREYRFDIKSSLTCGTNALTITFYSPVEYCKEEREKEREKYGFTGQTDITNLRKTQCHFGWDWGPVLPPSGIMRPIYIECRNVAAIDEVIVVQNHVKGQVAVDVEVKLRRYSKDKTKCLVELVAPDGQSLQNIEVDIKDSAKCSFNVENPQLWWTRDQSKTDEQPIYSLKTKLLSGNTLIDEIEKRIGLRTIELDRSRDEYGVNFRFIINGVPLFIKGANWIPADSFVNRFDDAKLRSTIQSVCFSNMNMLRIWGGGYYETDEMYELCDRKGILLWQEFGFACKPYPFFKEDFLANVLVEVEQNIKRLRHHACLAVWSGNNEIESLSPAWLLKRTYVEWTEKFFWNILPQEVRKYDQITPYIPGSPVGIAHNIGYSADNVGDTHLWAVWHGLQNMKYYRKRPTRFCSEFGFESLPDLKTIKRFAEEKDYDLYGEVFTSHQKCSTGNWKMVYYITSRFRLPAKFEDFVYLSQITQQECIKDATEFWRRNKGRCNGSMYWQLNDCWPVCSWASLDYFGNYKALQYTSRSFFAPVTVIIDDSRDMRIIAVNDTRFNQTVTVRYAVFDFEKGVLIEQNTEVALEPLAQYTAFSFPTREVTAKYGKKHVGILAELIQDGVVINRKTALFQEEKKLKLPSSRLNYEVSVINDLLTVKLTANAYARLICVESSLSMLPFSDNFFDLLTGESITVTQQLDSQYTVQELCNSISVKCVTDILPKGSRFSDWCTKMCLWLKPKAFFSWLASSVPPPDASLKYPDRKF